MVPVDGESAEPVRYKLRGVLYHHGESASSGHYSVDVLHQNEDSGSGEAWLRIDDEAVSTVRHEDVFLEHENDRCAYMLFYSRLASAQISGFSTIGGGPQVKKKKKKLFARRLIALPKKFK